MCQKMHESMINAVEMRSLRRMCGISLWDRIRNDEVRDRVGLKESIGARMKKGMLRWFGHVERMNTNRLTYQIYKAEVKGKKSRGRPRLNYHNQIERILSVGEVRSPRNRRACMKRAMTVDDAKVVCRDRVKWGSIISAYPARDPA